MQARLLLLSLAAATVSVDAHGGMVKPVPRAITTMKLNIDSTFGHPIGMRTGYTNDKGGDCLGFTPDTNLQPLTTGDSVVELRANDGANHVGPCKMSLVSPSDKSKRLEVGSHPNCMRSVHAGPGAYGDKPIKGEIKIKVPASGLPCDNGHCVLLFEWEATHLSPHELFNNCADVKINGAASGGSSETKKGEGADEKGEKKKDGDKEKKKDEEEEATDSPKTTKPKDEEATTKPVAAKGKYEYAGKDANKAAMDTWCNWNCPKFCPEDICKEV